MRGVYAALQKMHGIVLLDEVVHILPVTNPVTGGYCPGDCASGSADTVGVECVADGDKLVADLVLLILKHLNRSFVLFFQTVNLFPKRDVLGNQLLGVF